jgi:hypothetical protein
MFLPVLTLLLATLCFGEGLQVPVVPGYTPDTTSALWPLSSGYPPRYPTCHTTEVDGILTLHIKIVEFGNNTNVNITVLVSQVVEPTNSATHTFGGSLVSLQIFLGFTELYTFVTRVTTGGLTHTTIHWGPIVHGASFATFDVFNNTITGNVDNRTFNPFPITQDPSSITFTDGRPAPQLSAPSGLNDTLHSFPNLLKRVSRALTSCISSVITPPSANVTQGLISRDLDRSQDPGHFSSTYDTSSCNWCKVIATAAGTADGVLCAASTCWWSFGVGCVVCIAQAAATTVAGIESCESGSDCCPVHCGFGSPSTCCLGDETCLDFNTGHCCAGDQQPCERKECCNADQSCISQGPMKGTCCPDGPAGSSICGDLCCPHDTDQCVLNAICCAPADVCGENGETCCSPIDPLNPSIPVLSPKTCAGPDHQICCLYGQHSHNGVCCYPGEIVVDGICCAPGSVACNGECCAGTCSADGVCQYTITDAQCAAKGYFQGSCGSHLGEWSCQSCYPNGCCVQTPR